MDCKHEITVRDKNYHIEVQEVDEDLVHDLLPPLYFSFRRANALMICFDLNKDMIETTRRYMQQILEHKLKNILLVETKSDLLDASKITNNVCQFEKE